MKNLDTPGEFCKKYDECAEGMAFAARFATLAEAWDACPRADLMIWAMRKADKTEGLERILRIFACDCAEAAKPTDPRSLAAIAIARRFADGLATAGELRAAYASACAAARASAARAAAYASAYASASVSADAAAAAAVIAARDAAYAHAAATSATYDARAAAYAATQRTQAERLRALIANPFSTA